MGLYGLSGFCMVALETLWMHEISLWAGNTVVAATLVIAVFFVAAALGNLIGALMVERRQNSLFLYGYFEIFTAASATLTLLIGRWIWSNITAWPLEQVSVTILLVGLPSFSSGFAFPILTEALVASPQLRTIKAGPLYGMNLLGAAFGAIFGAVLLPWCLGLNISFAVVLGLQAAGGGAACILLATRKNTQEKERKKPVKKLAINSSQMGLMALALSGLLSLATQILLIQWARQILQGSVFAISSVLSVFIAGLGLGSLLAAKLRRRGHPSMHLLAVFAGLSALMLFIVPMAGRWLVGLEVTLGSLGPLGMLRESLEWSLLALLPLTICMGGVFPVAWELAAGDQHHQGAVLGRMLAINKMGSGIGASIGTFLILPGLGLVLGTNALAWSYLGISVVAMSFGHRRIWLFAVTLITVSLGLWAAIHSGPALGVSSNETLIANYSGFYGPVSVVKNQETDSRQILLNSRQRLSGTQHALSSQWHQGWVPLLFCPHPERVLTIGMAAGITSGATLDFPIKELDAIELVPEVVRGARENFSEWNNHLFSDPRVKVMTGDGRVILGRLPGKFDAIICDLFFPTEDATANLYSRDFFQRAKDHLQSDGVFCLWLPCYQHDAKTAGMIIHTFVEVFPNAILIRSNLDPIQPVIGLLGSPQPISVSRPFLAKRLSSLGGTIPSQQSPFFRSSENAQLLFAGDLHACDPDFSEFPITTDDSPLYAFWGPREPKPRERLIGTTFLNWIGRRFLEARYPSCNLENTSPQDLLSSTRAGNYYFATAIALSEIPTDSRSPETREKQIISSLQQAKNLSPKVELPQESLGR